MNKPPSVKETNQLQDDPLSLWPDSQSRPQDGLFRISRWLPSRSGGWTWTRMMVRLLLHGCVQELYSLLFRMRFQYRSATLHGGVGVGPLVEPDCNVVLQPCKR